MNTEPKKHRSGRSAVQDPSAGGVKSTPRQVAVGEASHAVVRRALGYRIESVTTREGGETKLVNIDHPLTDDAPVIQTSRRPAAELLAVRARMVGREMAGEEPASTLGELEALDSCSAAIVEQLGLGTLADPDDVAGPGSSVHGSLTNFLDEALTKTAEKVLERDDVWLAIEDVAAELEATGHVSGEQFEELVATLMPKPQVE